MKIIKLILLFIILLIAFSCENSKTDYISSKLDEVIKNRYKEISGENVFIDRIYQLDQSDIFIKYILKWNKDRQYGNNKILEYLKTKQLQYIGRVLVAWKDGKLNKEKKYIAFYLKLENFEGWKLFRGDGYYSLYNAFDKAYLMETNKQFLIFKERMIYGYTKKSVSDAMIGIWERVAVGDWKWDTSTVNYSRPYSLRSAAAFKLDANGQYNLIDYPKSIFKWEIDYKEGESPILYFLDKGKRYEGRRIRIINDKEIILSNVFGSKEIKEIFVKK